MTISDLPGKLKADNSPVRERLYHPATPEMFAQAFGAFLGPKNAEPTAWQERLEAERMAIREGHNDGETHYPSEYDSSIARGPLTEAETNGLLVYRAHLLGESVLKNELRLADAT